MFFKLVLTSFKLKKLVIEPKMAQPVKEPVDQLCSSSRPPVEGGQKVFLSPTSLLFPVEVILFPVEVRLRSDWDPVVTYQVLNAND